MTVGISAGSAVVASIPTVSLVNNNASPIVVGAPVYSVAAGACDLAQGSTAAKARCVGLVSIAPSIAASASGPIQSSGSLALTTAQWDAVAGTTGGLAFGTAYYVDSTTAGKLTATAPTASGKYVTLVGVGLSATILGFNLQSPIGPIP